MLCFVTVNDRHWKRGPVEINAFPTSACFLSPPSLSIITHVFRNIWANEKRASERLGQVRKTDASQLERGQRRSFVNGLVMTAGTASVMLGMCG